jgi:NTE family protein
MLHRAFVLLVFLWFGGHVDGAFAQSGHPKTCLVLGGGGARGAAHIGVLKVL